MKQSSCCGKKSSHTGTEMAVYRLTFFLCVATAAAFAPHSPPGFRGGSRFVEADAKGRTYSIDTSFFSLLFVDICPLLIHTFNHSLLPGMYTIQPL
jgi:hypothetical protein